MIFKLRIDATCEEEVIATVHERSPLIDEIEQMVLQTNVVDKIPCYDADEIAMMHVGQIACFISEEDKTYAVCTDNKKYLVKKRLYELEKILPKQFLRISKSAIANWQQIARFKVQLSGAVDAVFKSGYTDCVSRRCFAELKRRYGL